jgi:hypothetical protein
MPTYQVKVTEEVRHSKIYRVEAATPERAEDIAVLMAINDPEGVPFMQVDDRYAEVL